MGTTELKSSITQLIKGTTDNSLLELVYELLSKANTNGDDWYDSLSSHAKASIQRGIEDADNGRFIPHSEVKTKVDKLLGRK